MAALEMRAADPQLRAMLTAYLTDAALPQGSRVLEVGCGTGAVIRMIATWPGVSSAVGVDPSPVFVAKARELARGLPSLNFEIADGRSLPFAADSFEAVVFHTTLCHVPEPQILLAEAMRVLRPRGRLPRRISPEPRLRRGGRSWIHAPQLGRHGSRRTRRFGSRGFERCGGAEGGGSAPRRQWGVLRSHCLRESRGAEVGPVSWTQSAPRARSRL